MLKKIVGKLGWAEQLLAPDRGAPIVLMYHGIQANEGGRSASGDHKHVGESLFREHLELLARRRRVVPLSTLVDGLIAGADSRGRVAITFDDGYLNNVECAAPILKEYDMSATFFLATGFIGVNRWAWTDRLEFAVYNAPDREVKIRLGEPPEPVSVRLGGRPERNSLLDRIKPQLKTLHWQVAEERVAELAAAMGMPEPNPQGQARFMSWEQARKLIDDGFEVGAHTVNHAILSRVPLADAQEEILSSQAHVRSQAGQCCPTFCYPNGKATDFNAEVMQICHGHFDAALSAIRGAARIEDRFEIRRIGLSHETSVQRLASGLLQGC